LVVWRYINSNLESAQELHRFWPHVF